MHTGLDTVRLGQFTPRQPSLHWFAKHAHLSLPVTNSGDRMALVRLAGDDAARVCRFEFHAPGEPAALIEQMELCIEPGATADVTVHITPRRRRLLGLTQQEHLCTISAAVLDPRLPPADQLRECHRRSMFVRLHTAPLIGPVALLILTACTLVVLGLWVRPDLERMTWQSPQPQWGVPGGARAAASPLLPRTARRSVDLTAGHNSDDPLTYERMFQEIADHYDLDWRLLAQLAYEESRLNPAAVGGCGEMGLMQIRPSTWEQFAQEVGVTDAYDPYSSAMVAAAYLVYLKGYLGQWGYPEDYWMLAAYNWGPDNLRRMLIAGGGWTGVPSRTQGYALRILQAAGSGSMSPPALASMQTPVSAAIRLSQLPADHPLLE